MRRLRSALVLGLAGVVATSVLATAPSSAEAGDLKLGVVDVQKVMESSPEWKTAVKTLERDWEKKAAELEAKQLKLKQAKEQLDGKRALVNDGKALRVEEERLIGHLKEFRREYMVSQQQFQQREAVLKDQMLGRVEKVVYQLAAEGDYAYIFETGSTEAPNVLYAQKSIDLTARAIKGYQKLFKGKKLDTNAPIPNYAQPPLP
jgi:outer membrane protein